VYAGIHACVCVRVRACVCVRIFASLSLSLFSLLSRIAKCSETVPIMIHEIQFKMFVRTDSKVSVARSRHELN